MNTLPPELLSSIIESAAECSSIYESWEERLQTLSALALVNRTFYHIAQPLLPQKVYLRRLYLRKEESKGLEALKVADKLNDLVRNGISHKIISVTFENLSKRYPYTLPKLDEFSNLKEMRLVDCYGISLNMLQSHQHLARLILVSTWVDHDPSTDLTLPSIIEVTVENTVIIVPDSYRDGTTALFLTQTYFPSLRALGLYYFCGVAATNFLRSSPFSPDPALLAQLDCWAINDDTQLPNLPLPVPFLYDVDPASLPSTQTNRTTSQARLCLAADMESASTKTHVRICFPCAPDARDHHIDKVLSFVDTLLGRSTVLQEVYLDLQPRDGRRDYVLSQNLGEKIKKLEKLAKEKKVEIIWENHEDDWCRSRVSKEFWRRCKGRKDKQQD